MPTTKQSGSMSDTHKAALAEGRKHAKNVRTYLDAVRASNAPKKKGRKRSPEQLMQRISEIESELANGSVDDTTKELQLRQERMDLADELEMLQEAEETDPAEFEAGFVESAKSYAESKGISYSAFREMGVAAAVLKKAGIGR